VRKAFASGLITRASLNVKQKAVFIDRDGTLNRDAGHITRAEDFELFPGIGAALHRLNENEWRSIVVTNQPVLARGETSWTEMRRIHAKLDSIVAKDQAFFDRLYLCPHHPDKGFTGEITELKIRCNCRKPAPGLLLQASSDLNINLSESWMIGDSTADLGAAENAGVSCIIVRTGCAGLDGRYIFKTTFTQPDFAAAVSFILDAYPRLEAVAAPLLEQFAASRLLFIGGLARSGRSTLAGTLQREMRRKGQQARVIALDRFVKDQDNREKTVLERYNLDEIEALVRKINAFHIGEVDSLTLTLPACSRKSSTYLQKAASLTLHKEDRVILEGITALEIARRLKLTAYSIYIEDKETNDGARLASYNHRRGLSAEQSQAILAARATDENMFVCSSAKDAAFKLSLKEVFSDIPSSI